MSRSNKELDFLQNPSTRWFEWVGSEGKLKWYEKETKETHYVDLPFRFLVLDQLNTVTGYSDEMETGFYSNEVRKTDEILTVRTKKGVYQKGIWKDDLSNIKGARFTKSVYIAYYDDKELKLGNIKFSGSALGGLSDAVIAANLKDHKKDSGVELFTDELLESVGWFNFTKKHGAVINEIAVEITDKIWDKKGTNDFYRPVFKPIEVAESTNQKAIEIDKELQVYLTAYLAKNHSNGSVEETEFEGFPENPIARSISDLVTAKQLEKIRGLGMELGVDPDEECQQQMKCDTVELNKKGASALIQHLTKLSSNESWKNSVGDFSNPPDDDIPF